MERGREKHNGPHCWGREWEVVSPSPPGSQFSSLPYPPAQQKAIVMPLPLYLLRLFPPCFGETHHSLTTTGGLEDYFWTLQDSPSRDCSLPLFGGQDDFPVPPIPFLPCKSSSSIRPPPCCEEHNGPFHTLLLLGGIVQLGRGRSPRKIIF